MYVQTLGASLPADAEQSAIASIIGGTAALRTLAANAKGLIDLYAVASQARSLAQQIFGLDTVVFNATKSLLPEIYAYQAKAADLSQGAIQTWAKWDGSQLNPWSPGFTPYSPADWDIKLQQLRAVGQSVGATSAQVAQASNAAIQASLPTAPVQATTPSATMPVQTRLPTTSNSPAAAVPGTPGGADPVSPVPSLADDAANAAQATGVALQHGIGAMSPKALAIGALAIGALLLLR